MTHIHHVFIAMRRETAVFLLQSLVTCAFGQTAHEVSPFEIRQHSTLVGGGISNVLDTYLSPYNYTGEHATFIYEMQRPLHRFATDSLHPKLKLRQLIRIDGIHAKNPARNMTEWAGGLDYSLTWLYTLTPQSPAQTFSIETGPMLSAYLGGIYNEHNGNNPAQAKASLTLQWAVRSSLHFQIFQRNTLLQYTLSAPVVGMAFSPAYGQSYYEAFGLGHYDHNLVFAHPFNMPSMQHLITLDVPLHPVRSATSLRIGYAADFMQSKFNGLRYHNYSHTLLIGVTRFFKRL